MRDHKEGFEKEESYYEIFAKARELCPQLKHEAFKQIVKMLNPGLSDGLFARRPCVRKLKCIGFADWPDMSAEERQREESELSFVVGDVYESEDFNGATYTIICSESKFHIGCAYFEWID